MSAGMRAVLVIPRTDVGKDPALEGAIDQILHSGGTLVAVVAPEDHRKALQMVLDDRADVVVVTSPEHFPLVQFAAYMNGAAPRSAKRTQRVMRPGSLAEDARPKATPKSEPVAPAPDHPWRTAGGARRPQLVPVVDEPPAPAEPPRERRTSAVERGGRRPQIVREPGRTQRIRRTG